MVLDKFFFNLSFKDLENQLAAWNEPGFRVHQIWEALYDQLKTDPMSFTNIPKDLRIKLQDNFGFSNLKEIDNTHSKDFQTYKSLYELSTGARIETVLMRYDHRETLCISTQSGCAMGCKFCATGKLGFQQNLTAGEIVEQVIKFATFLKNKDCIITNIVFMGMGEPFLNYDNTLKAIAILNHPRGFNLGKRRFTISTVGIIPGIERIARDDPQVNIAISLHAANDDLRKSIIPIAEKYSLEELFHTCKEYISLTHRRISFEWAMIQGVNDSPRDAFELANKIKHILCHVNLIPLNPIKDYDHLPSNAENIFSFKNLLESNGIQCSIRLRRGIEISAGCGQLAAKST
jgi:23S rRNA (adenine2503-C2)-methyltransferase